MSTREPVDLLIHGIGKLYTLEEDGLAVGPRRRGDVGRVGLVENGAVASYAGRIVAVGAEDDVRRKVRVLPGAKQIDAEGAAVIPGFVDPHTHAVFDDPRSWEFGRRLVGESYASIAEAGGGIRATVRAFREVDEEVLVRRTRRRLRAALAYGSTTVEVKSGYGLELESELRALRVVKRLQGDPHLPDLVATCLAAHEFPDEWRDDRDGYVRLVCEEILPAVAEEGLAERADVFCEPGVYTVEQSRRVLEAAASLGMRGTVHADELEGSGGAELAAELGADSADHLGRISDAGIDALADSDTVGVLLPGTIFSLGLNEQAPARRMIDAGVALALATDFNPGSNWCESMPLTLAIACTRLHLHPHEALTMATINAAHALRRADHVGSLAVGKSMDVNILRGDSVDSLAHHLGLDPLQKVVRDGRVVVDHGAPIGV
jgi:imidazolonepropionase